MPKSTTLTVRMTSELKDQLNLLADSTQRTKSFLAAQAIEKYVARELAIIQGIERAREDVQAGRVVSHEQVQSDIAKIIAEGRSQAGIK
ncbi:MAG: CopG family ribbon-helix-helix protein [Pseudomonadota bacterium]